MSYRRSERAEFSEAFRNYGNCSVRFQNAPLLRADIVSETQAGQRYIPRAEIDRLVDWLPALRTAPDLDRVPPLKLFSYITAESLMLLVQRRLDEDNLN